MSNRMPGRRVALALALLLGLAASVTCLSRFVEITPPGIAFARTVTDVGPDGRPYPIVDISGELPRDLTEVALPLDGSRRLVVRSNDPTVGADDLEEMRALVAAAYLHLESATGRRIARDVLLHLLLLDEVPPAYHVEMRLPQDANPWSFVGFVVLPKSAMADPARLRGELDTMLYDTLPHELGHQLLRPIANLPHDNSREPSFGTRWFIDGTCEWLAKDFARSYDRDVWERELKKRRADRILGEPGIRESLFAWPQEDGGDQDGRDADLYGAALLVVGEWVAAQPLREILDGIERSDRRMDGAALKARMLEVTGHDEATLLDRAQARGKAWTREAAGLWALEEGAPTP